MHSLTRVVAVAATLILAAAPVLVAGPAAAASAPYKLTYQKQSNGKQALLRWNPCRAHTYKVNLAAVPAKSRLIVLGETHAAMRTLAAKTGMSFAYKGQTGEVPRVGSSAKQTADLIIAYTTPAKTNYSLAGPIAGQGGAMGLTRWTSSGANTNYTTAITKGFVVIDTPDMLRISKFGLGAGLSHGNLLLHELGHVVGLGHVNNASLLMNGQLSSRSPKGYAGADLAGLAKVGRKAGCINGF
jgi:hypothetical protein